MVPRMDAVGAPETIFLYSRTFAAQCKRIPVGTKRVKKRLEIVLRVFECKLDKKEEAIQEHHILFLEKDSKAEEIDQAMNEDEKNRDERLNTLKKERLNTEVSIEQ